MINFKMKVIKFLKINNKIILLITAFKKSMSGFKILNLKNLILAQLI